MANDPIVNLSPPPKFQGQASPIIGPTSPADWLDFYRWLFAQYRAVKLLMGTSTPPGAFPSALAAPPDDNLPGQFPALPMQQVDPGAIIALATTFSRENVSRETQASQGFPPPPTFNREAAVSNATQPPIPQGFPPPPAVNRTSIEIVICTQATFPTLTGGSIAIFVYVSDFHHMIYWDGTTALFSDGGNRFVGLFEVDPGAGWALYDGSTVAALNADGTTSNVVLPDLTSTAAVAAFLEAGGTNSGPTAAVAPTISGNTETAVTGISVSGGSGITTTSGSVASGTGALATFITSVSGGGGGGAVTDPGHVHALLAIDAPISATGEPRKLVRRPYFRL